MGRLSENKHIYNYFFHPEILNTVKYELKNNDDRNAYNKKIYSPLDKNNKDTSFLGYKFVQTEIYDYLYIKSPEIIEIEENIIDQIYSILIKKEKISFKMIDKILLKSLYPCSNSFHKILNKKFKNNNGFIIINSKINSRKIQINDNYLIKSGENIKERIKKFIINVCVLDSQFPKIGKCSKNVFNKVYFVLKEIYKLDIDEHDIRKISFLFNSNEYFQTKRIIINFLKNKDNECIIKFPLLFIKHMKLNEMNGNEFLILLSLILSHFKTINNINNKYDEIKNKFEKADILIFYKEHSIFQAKFAFLNKKESNKKHIKYI